MAISRSQMPKQLKPGLGRNWKRDPYAKSLQSRLYSPKVITSKKLYNRKRRSTLNEDEGNGAPIWQRKVKQQQKA